MDCTQEALALGRRAYQVRNSFLEPCEHQTLTSLYDLIAMLLMTGQLDETVPLMKQGLRESPHLASAQLGTS